MRWLLLLGWLLPAPAFACAVCGIGPNDVAGWAFLRGTALLSLMPLSVIGGIVYYLYRETKRAERSKEADGPVAVPAPHASPDLL